MQKSIKMMLKRELFAEAKRLNIVVKKSLRKPELFKCIEQYYKDEDEKLCSSETIFAYPVIMREILSFAGNHDNTLMYRNEKYQKEVVKFTEINNELEQLLTDNKQCSKALEIFKRYKTPYEYDNQWNTLSRELGRELGVFLYDNELRCSKSIVSRTIGRRIMTLTYKKKYNNILTSNIDNLLKLNKPDLQYWLKTYKIEGYNLKLKKSQLITLINNKRDTFVF